MANALPPVKGSAYSFEMSLVSQADTDTFQDNPTLAAGDVKVVKDGTLDGNIDSLPTAVGSLTRVITVTLSADEMNADRVAVLFHDAAGDEWQDALVFINTAAQTLDTIDTNVDSVLTDTGTTIPAQISGLNDLSAADVNAEVDTALSDYDAPTKGELDAAQAAIQADIGGLNDPSAADVADAVWDEARAGHTTAGTFGLYLDAQISGVGGAVGPGSTAYTITVTDGANPLDGAEVWISTDAAGLNVIAGTLSTDAMGEATFMLDPGDYYVWVQLAGYNFTNPTAVTVP